MHASLPFSEFESRPHAAAGPIFAFDLSDLQIFDAHVLSLSQHKSYLHLSAIDRSNNAVERERRWRAMHDLMLKLHAC